MKIEKINPSFLTSYIFTVPIYDLPFQDEETIDELYSYLTLFETSMGGFIVGDEYETENGISCVDVLCYGYSPTSLLTIKRKFKAYNSKKLDSATVSAIFEFLIRSDR